MRDSFAHRIYPAFIFLVTLVAAFFTLTKLQLHSFAIDPGLGWHLFSGKQIAETRSVPYVDTFLSTSRPWICDQWLSDLVLHLSYQLKGWELLYALGSLLYLTTFFIVLYPLHILLGSRVTSVAIGVFIALKMGLVHFILRPVLISFFLFTIVWAILVLYSRHIPKKTPQSFLFLPLVFLFWANLHPSFFLGLGLIILALFSFVIDKSSGYRLLDSSLTGRLFGVLLICSVVTLINPYNVDLHKSIISLAESDYFMSLNEEWHPLNMSGLEGFHFRLILGTCLTGIFFFGRHALSISTFEFLTVLCFALMTLVSGRFAPYFGIVSCSFIVRILDLIFERVNKNLTNHTIKYSYVVKLFSIFSLIVLGCTFYFQNVPTYNGEYGPPKNLFPFQAMEVLNKETSKLLNPIVYNHPNWGGFIIWNSSGKIRPVFDDRNTLLGEDMYKEFLQNKNLESSIQSSLRKHNAQFLLLKRADLDTQCNSLTGLRILHEDNLSVLASVIETFHATPPHS